jgi:hypothetical protein
MDADVTPMSLLLDAEDELCRAREGTELLMSPSERLSHPPSSAHVGLAADQIRKILDNAERLLEAAVEAERCRLALPAS